MGDFLAGAMMMLAFVVVVASATCKDFAIAEHRANARSAMGCTVIPAEESNVVSADQDAVFWRCKDGKVYVR